MVGASVTTLALGSQPRQGHGKVRAKSAIRESHLHSRSVKECERMNPHTPKWILTLGIKASMESRIFKEQFQGLIFIRLKSSLYHSKYFDT
jgi:hypothetical protein